MNPGEQVYQTSRTGSPALPQRFCLTSLYLIVPCSTKALPVLRRVERAIEEIQDAFGNAGLRFGCFRFDASSVRLSNDHRDGEGNSEPFDHRAPLRRAEIP
jgi:hypothetical protein